MTELPNVLNILVISQISDEALARIKAVDPKRLNVIAAYAEFLDETIADNATMLSRRSSPPPKPTWTPAEREATLGAAHAILLSFPFPRNLVVRAHNALWYHCPFAGVSNLRGTSYWGASAAFTTSRGYTQALPIAETSVAAIMMFAKRLGVAAVNTEANEFDRSQGERMGMVEGKTVGIVGLGGIGSHVARLSRGLGMRVVATRRSTKTRVEGTDGVDVLYPAAEMKQMLAGCDYVVVSSMWTDETQGLINADAFAAMKDGVSLLNVARGEIVEEQALIDALKSGKVANAYLDVYKDDFTQPPTSELAGASNIVITPHISGRSDVSHAFSIDVFCKNLERLLAGNPLENLVDWKRGY